MLSWKKPSKNNRYPSQTRFSVPPALILPLILPLVAPALSMLALSLLGRLGRLGRLLLPSLLTPERLKSRHGRANWSRRHKHGSAPPIIHGCHSWWKACCSARRWLLLLRLLLRLLPIARLWAGSENLPCAMGVLGKLHVIGVPVGLATVFVRMDVRLCHRHLHTIRDRRASGQCDTPGPSF